MPSGPGLPARLGQQRLGLRRVVRVLGHVVRIHRVERVHPGVGDRLLALEQALRQGLAVDRVEQRAAGAQIGEDRVVDLQVDVLVGQRRLEDVGELVGRLLLQRDHLVDGQAHALAVHHVDVAGLQVGQQRRGLVDQLA